MSHILKTAKKKTRDLPLIPLSVVNCASAGTLPAEAESLRPLQGRWNKQQATTTTTRHHSVLATAPSHRLELDSTLAILEARWWPCQIQVLSQKLTGGDPGRGRQVGRCPPKYAQLWAKNSHFSPKTALVRV